MVDQPEIKEIKIDVPNVESYIGHPIYRSSKIYGIKPPAVSLY